MKYQDWMKYVKQIRTDNQFGSLKEYKNEEGRLHRDNAPAYISPTTLISYRNGLRHGVCYDIWGSKTYYFDDVLVPNKYLEQTDQLTIEEIITNPNAEVRAVGVRIYGFERLLREERFKVVEIEQSTNYMLLLWEGKSADDSFCVVRVFNSTTNPDGTVDTYYLTVPPNMKTVREAVAWTFYKEADEYCPVQET